MSDAPSTPIIDVRGVGKRYKVFPTRVANFIDAVGLSRLTPWRKDNYREFWALRDINLTVRKGERVGVIGCNGAGKSTLLKLITGNIPPTQGKITVEGDVHALMNTGAGFHPEFTGRENMVASLSQQGMSRAEMDAAIADIIEFTELEEFLDQQFKTYSAGMQARLTFATATAIHPNVLIIDEILGAGDGYFIAKSTERITTLVENHGATVLLVSHSLGTITRFCETALWIDRGKVMEFGPALEVCKSYEQFLRLRTERRLRAKNEARKNKSSGVSDAAVTFAAHAVVRCIATGPDGSAIDVAELDLREGDESYEAVRVGDAQDADTSRTAFVTLPEVESWSTPQEESDIHYRSLPAGHPAGECVFYLYSFLPHAPYSVRVRGRSRNGGALRVEIWSQGSVIHSEDTPLTGDWSEVSIGFSPPRAAGASKPPMEPLLPTSPGAGAPPNGNQGGAKPSNRSVKRWPGEGTLRISDVVLHGGDSKPRAVFEAGTPMTLTMTVCASQAGEFPIVPTVAVYRLDGVPVTRHRGVPVAATLATGETRNLRLEFGPLNLGDGNYVISVGAFREFDAAIPERAKPYEIIDRSYEFEVVGNPPNMDAVFQHPGTWTLERPAPQS